jgi:hypothetical protein
MTQLAPSDGSSAGGRAVSCRSLHALDPSGLGGGLTALDLMIARPKVLPADASVGDVRELFGDDHVVMVLLGERGLLLGTLLRDDLPDAAPSSAPTLRWSVMTGRTVSPADPAAVVCRRLLEGGRSRLAVVDDVGRLLGLVCLKRQRNGLATFAAAGDPGGPATARSLVMHELGQVLGMHHPDDPSQLMHATSPVRELGDGDPRGLSILGQGGCEPRL